MTTVKTNLNPVPAASVPFQPRGENAASTVQTAIENSASIYFTQDGTHAARRLMRSKIADHKDILDYLSESQAESAIAGALDLTALLQFILDELPNSKGTVTFKRPGNYLFQRNGSAFGVTIGSNRAIVFDKGVKCITEAYAVGVNGFATALLRNSDMSGGNENIRIEGGQFQVATQTASYGGGCFLAFKKVTGLELVGQTCLDTVNSVKMQVTNCADFLIDNYYAKFQYAAGTHNIQTVYGTPAPTVYSYGDALRIGSGSRNGRVRGLRLDSYDDAIAIANERAETDGSYTGIDIKGIEISDCVVTTEAGHALSFYHESGMVAGTISGVHVRGLTAKPVHVAGNAGVRIYDASGRIAITNCSVADLSLDLSGMPSTTDGVTINGADLLTFDNPTVTNFKQYGFSIANGTRTRISNPYLAGGTGSADGVLVGAASTGTKIASGHIYSCGRDGVCFQSADCEIDSVRFSNNARSNIRLESTGAKVRECRHSIHAGTAPAVHDTTNGNTVWPQDVRGCSLGVTYLDTSKAGGVRNKWVNGGCQIWQRGTGSTACVSGGQTYLADRIYVNPTGANMTQQRSTSVPIGSMAQYSVQLVGNTSVTTVLLGTRIEAAEVVPLRRTVTFQASIYNATGSAFTPNLLIGTPAAADDFTTVTNRLTQALQSCVDSTWTTVFYTVDIAAYTNIANGVQLELQFPSGPLNSSGKTVYVTELSIRPGVAVEPFEHVPVSMESQRCRYYYFEVGGADVYQTFAGGYVSSTTLAYILFKLPLMRSAPSLSVSAVGDFAIGGGASFAQCTNIYTAATGTDIFMIAAVVASGLTVGDPASLAAYNNTSARIKFSADL